MRHPNKVAWLIHQYRAAYELAGTPFSDFGHTEADVALRERLIALDTAMLGECRRLFANSRNTADRARRYNGLPVEAALSSAAARRRACAAARPALSSCRSAGSKR